MADVRRREDILVSQRGTHKKGDDETADPTHVVMMTTTDTDGKDEEQKASPVPPVATLPPAESALLASAYVLLFIFFFLAVRYSQTKVGEGFSYDSTLVVFLIELTKLCACCVLYQIQERRSLLALVFWSPRAQRTAVWRAGALYLVPSFLYAIYNNLTFYNLSLVDPGTFQIIMQSRMIFTGVIFTFALAQPLSLRKWAVLIVITIACLIKFYSTEKQQKPKNGVTTTASPVAPGTLRYNNSTSGGSFALSGSSVVWTGFAFAMVVLQALLSALAGVYNEYVLKSAPSLSIHLQNFFMYFSALGFNIAFSLLLRPGSLVHTITHLRESTHSSLLPVIIFGSLGGISASLILKYINSVVKALASSVEVLLTAVLASLLLGESLTVVDVLVSLLVVCCVFAYNTPGWGDDVMIYCGMKSRVDRSSS